MNRRHKTETHLDVLLIVSAWCFVIAAIMYYPAEAEVQAIAAQSETGGAR